MLIPQLHVEYQAVPGGQWGQVQQETHVSGDNVAMLMGSPDVVRDGLYLEPNTGTILLEPSIRPIDFGVSQTTQAGTGSSWRDTVDRATGKRIVTQYNATADLAQWTVESTGNVIDVDNGGFSVTLYLGAPPKSTTDRSAAGVFRRITWASASAAGENRFRVTIPYQGGAYLERSVDAGSTWAREATIESSVDLSTLRTARNAQITLSVLCVLSPFGGMVVWLGDGIRRGGTLVSYNPGYKTGKVKIEGKGGYTSIGFANIRHATSGTLTSYQHFGPPDMHSPTAQVLTHHGDPSALPAGSSVAGAIATRDETVPQFQYALTLAAADGGDGYAKTSPWVDQVTVVWPILRTAPVSGSWSDLAPHVYEERLSFDPASRILSRWHRITARIYGSELHPLHGVDAVRAYMSYKHEIDEGGSEVLRSYFIGGTDTRLFSQGRDAFIQYEGHGLLWQLAVGFIKRRMFPSHWCVYSVVRMALEAAGIVPEFYTTFPLSNDGVNYCAFGPYPANCPHAQFGSHPGFAELTPCQEIVDACRDLIFAWYGEDATGQFRFEAFNPDSYTTIVKAFTELGTSNADAGTNYDELGQALPDSLVRTRSLSGVKNDVSLVGIDQVSGAFIPAHWRDVNSITDQGAVNFVGFVRPYAEASSLFLNLSFTEANLAALTKWLRLPFDEVYLPVPMQPHLFTSVEMGGLISVQELRTIGPAPLPLFVTDVYHRVEGAGMGRCWIRGLWTGTGTLPGTQVPPPQRPGPVDNPDGNVPIPGSARLGGSVYGQSGGPVT